MTRDTKPNPKLLTLSQTVSLGVGTMIGAGIFALFGNIASLAGGYAWLAFLCAGIISSLTGYSYYKLSHLSHTNGGLAEYLNLGWNKGRIGSVISLCYFFSVTIVLGLVSKAFGHYAGILFELPDGYVNILAISVMVVFLIVNARGAKFVGRIEQYLVVFKLLILIGFIGVCSYRFSASTYATNQLFMAFDSGKFINAVALANLSFAGFAVVANAGGSVKKAGGVIGRSIFISIAIVGLIYIGLNISIFGNMTIESIVKAKDYALAQAALPVLGQWGFTLLAVTAIVSTSTNINANIMSATNTISYMADEKRMISALSKVIVGKRGSWAMLATVALVIVMIVALNLSEIANVASMTFLLVHTFIPLGNVLNVAKETGANRAVLWLAVICNGGILGYFIYHLVGTSNLELYVFAAVITIAIIIQWLNAIVFKGSSKAPT
jgi:amino acid transporter